MAGERITQDEMIGMFGERMPTEAMHLLWSADDKMTVGEVRDALRDIARKTRVRCPHCSGLVDIPK